MTVPSARRVGVFVTGAFVRNQYRQAVSGHVQIALMAARILAEAGHDVTLITTRPPDADGLPQELPDAVDVTLVQHATRSWPAHKVYPAKAARQVLQLLALTRKRRFDVVHFFGGKQTGWLLCLLKLMGAPFTGFYTPIQRPPAYRSAARNAMWKFAFRRVTHFLPVTEYVAAGWSPLANGRAVTALHPGIVKPMSEVAGPTPRDTVLFWRNATHANGADLGVQAYRHLAPEYPNRRFVFAVRPGERYEDEMRDLARTIANVDLHVFPYQPPVSLPVLLSRSLLVVQPFRSLRINPQISTIETLYAGVPVITTDVESNRELVQHEKTGLIIPPDDVEALVAAIRRLLEDRDLWQCLQSNCAAATKSRWNWNAYGQELLTAYEHAGE